MYTLYIQWQDTDEWLPYQLESSAPEPFFSLDTATAHGRVLMGQEPELESVEIRRGPDAVRRFRRTPDGQVFAVLPAPALGMTLLYQGREHLQLKEVASGPLKPRKG